MSPRRCATGRHKQREVCTRAIHTRFVNVDEEETMKAQTASRTSDFVGLSSPAGGQRRSSRGLPHGRRGWQAERRLVHIKFCGIAMRSLLSCTIHIQSWRPKGWAGRERWHGGAKVGKKKPSIDPHLQKIATARSSPSRLCNSQCAVPEQRQPLAMRM